MRAGTSGPENYTGWKLVVLLSTQPCFPRKWPTSWLFVAMRSIIMNHHAVAVQPTRLISTVI